MVGWGYRVLRYGVGVQGLEGGVGVEDHQWWGGNTGSSVWVGLEDLQGGC